MRKTIKLMIGAAALAGWAVTAGAIEMTLDQLLVPGASIQVGDKVFDDFGWNSAVLPSHGINIKGIDEGNTLFTGNYGIDIQGSWTQFGPGTLDADLTYRVHVVGPQLITDVHQFVNGGGIGPFVASVSELVLTAPNGAVVGHLFNGASSLGNFSVGAALIAPGENTLWVNKDINLVVEAGGTVGSISDIEQTFSQDAPDGGATVAMLGLALLGAEGLRRKIAR